MQKWKQLQINFNCKQQNNTKQGKYKKLIKLSLKIP